MIVSFYLYGVFMNTDTEIIEELAKQVKNPTTVIINRKRYDALCEDYTPNSDEFETIELNNIVTASGNLTIRVVDTNNSTLIVQ